MSDFMEDPNSLEAIMKKGAMSRNPDRPQAHITHLLRNVASTEAPLDVRGKIDESKVPPKAKESIEINRSAGEELLGLINESVQKRHRCSYDYFQKFLPIFVKKISDLKISESEAIRLRNEYYDRFSPDTPIVLVDENDNEITTINNAISPINLIEHDATHAQSMFRDLADSPHDGEREAALSNMTQSLHNAQNMSREEWTNNQLTYIKNAIKSAEIFTGRPVSHLVINGEEIPLTSTPEELKDFVDKAADQKEEDDGFELTFEI